MKARKGGRLFRKYMFNMLILILIGMLIMGFLFLALETNRWSDEQTDNLLQDTGIISRNVQSLIYEDNEGSVVTAAPINIVSNTVNTLCSADDCDIFICNNSGEIVLCREMAQTRKKYCCKKHAEYNIPKDIIKSASEGNFNGITTLGNTFDIQQLVVASPIRVGSKTVGIVFAVKSVTKTLSKYISQVAKIMFLAAAITLLLSVGIIYGMVYKITKPLKEMSKAAKMYAEGDFSYKVKVRGGDELAELASAFNKMSNSLATLESSRRSFVANISHELKTPMTTIGGFIDGILDGTIDQDKEKHYLQIVSDEVKRLSRLVTGMLNMSKLEAGEMNINYKEFDLSQSIFKILLSFEKKINTKSIEITGLESMQSLNVEADEDMIMQVVYNLIDNAIKFTPAGGYISINTFSDGEKAYVSIRNSGEGISPEEIDRIFERFYKIDKSRSYDVKGAGLGLYIVKSIINLHKGEIKAESEQGEYTDFTFWLPISNNS